MSPYTWVLDVPVTIGMLSQLLDFEQDSAAKDDSLAWSKLQLMLVLLVYVWDSPDRIGLRKKDTKEMEPRSMTSQWQVLDA